MSAVTGVSLNDRLTQAAAAGDQTTKTAENAQSDLVSEQTFLKLLVAQIKNQNPLDPMEGIEFVSQLAQFSQLEQTIQMRTGIDDIRSVVEAAVAAGETTQETPSA
jgi:flagellar basal-body rod modification protein FlgD